MALAEMVREIESVMDRLDGCTEGERIEALRACERVRSAIAAHASALTSACDRHQDWAGDGAATPGVWVARVCDQPVSEGRRLVRQARRLESMPLTSAAFASGELGEAKVALLAAARTTKLADEFDRCEAMLVDAAKRLDPDGLNTALRRWRHVAADAVDPDPSCVTAEEDTESRPSELHLSPTMGGRWILHGDLTFEDGAILASGIDAATKSLFHRGARLSDGATFDASQRRGVALVETFKRGVDAHPDQAGAQPLLIATVDLGLLTRRAEREAIRESEASSTDERVGSRSGSGPASGGLDPGPTEEERRLTAARVATLVRERCVHRGEPPPSPWRPQAESPPSASRVDDQPSSTGCDDRFDPFGLDGLAAVPPPDPSDPFDLGRCEIPGAGPIPLDMARRLACNGRIARLVLDADGVPLDMGREVRLATPEQRRALVVRDGGCVFPGCDRAPGWCEAHHLAWWDEHDGTTDLANLALLCSHHHHLIHKHQWTLQRTETGWVAQSTAGRRIHRPIPLR